MKADGSGSRLPERRPDGQAPRTPHIQGFQALEPEGVHGEADTTSAPAPHVMEINGRCLGPAVDKETGSA